MLYGKIVVALGLGLLLVGPGLGALAGNALAGGQDRTIGSLVGGALGGAIGRSIDRGDLKCHRWDDKGRRTVVPVWIETARQVSPCRAVSRFVFVQVRRGGGRSRK
ncbi:glycine zipper 2TM domain-containing protein [Novosphingobium sp. BW1]|uniref:glycine zipper 2TM domain-containing protein n=1 Tax=Novosphingobium sp. BW1 TaxID=2592621 RepID=UPI001F07EF1C|nr:glycine zipper 2TM domain-containing protein [Novosphingobium sp. BW1]